MSAIKTFMEEQVKILEREIGRSRRILNIAPSGTLTVRKRDSKRYLYRLYTNRHGEEKDQLLKEKTRKIAERIQTRIIAEVHIKLMEAALKQIRRFLKYYKCCDWETARSKVKPMYREPLQYQGFLPQGNPAGPNAEGYSNRFHPEELIHKNSIGELFRSKGEVQVSELIFLTIQKAVPGGPIRSAR